MKYLVMIIAFSVTQVAFAQQAFNHQTIEALQKRFSGQNWLMVMWSLDCPPCFKELSHIAKLKSQVKTLPIILVNVDEESSHSERQDVIDNLQLTTIEHYFFLPEQAHRNRYQIDKQWHGELPRSYYIDATGQWLGQSGLQTKEKIKQWLQLP